MYPTIRQLATALVGQFDQIPAERKAILAKIAAYIHAKQAKAEPVRLVFICTHNSRRSHFGQVAAAVAAQFYGIDGMSVFSGGTEATAFHPNAIHALRESGLVVETLDESERNPVWAVRFGDNLTITCFSKVYDDPANPNQGFAAIMACSDAEQNCPFVPGTELRIGTTYDDPKVFDGTPAQAAKYLERFEQILREMLYMLSLVR